MDSVRCGFGWFDGKDSHVCYKTGEHEHRCDYCNAKHDPTLFLEPGKYGGFIKRRKKAQ